MTQTQTFIAHIVTLVLIIGSAMALAINGNIGADSAIAMIGTAVGITFGATVTSNGANVATAAQTAAQPTPVPAPAPATIAPASNVAVLQTPPVTG